MTTTALPPDTPKPEEQLQQHKPEEVSRRRFLFKLSIAANSIVGAVFAVPILGYLLGPVMKKGKAAEFWVGLGFDRSVSRGRDSARQFPRPVHGTFGWPDCRPAMLGEAHRREPVSGICYQLRSSWLPSALVLTVEAFHVSVPWRSLLPGRFPRLRTA